MIPYTTFFILKLINRGEKNAQKGKKALAYPTPLLSHIIRLNKFFNIPTN